MGKAGPEGRGCLLTPNPTPPIKGEGVEAETFPVRFVSVPQGWRPGGLLEIFSSERDRPSHKSGRSSRTFWQD